MTLHELLQTLPDPRTVENAKTWLAENITIPDDTKVTTTTIMAKMSPVDAATVFGTLHALEASNPLVKEALISLRGNGLDLSHTNARLMVDQLFSAELAPKVRALGEKTVPRWRQTDLTRLKDGYIEEAL